jgi:hypothetical protein
MFTVRPNGFDEPCIATRAVKPAAGSEVWRTKLGDINRGETITMAPLVFKDKVLKSGRLQINPDKQPKLNRTIRDICPTAPGAKDWNPQPIRSGQG